MQVLQLSKTSFDAEYACRGPQIAAVLDALGSMPEIGMCSWYAGAIDVIGTCFAPYEEHVLERVDDIAGLIEMTRSANQLLDGVFVAIDGKSRVIVGGPVTANGPMLPVAETSIVEVHAYDTSCIEIYSANPHLLAKVQQRFQGELKAVDVRL